MTLVPVPFVACLTSYLSELLLLALVPNGMQVVTGPAVNGKTIGIRHSLWALRLINHVSLYVAPADTAAEDLASTTCANRPGQKSY